MPVHTGYDSNKKEEPKCYARWGSTGKKYYYTCNNESAREKAKDKAAAQGRAIRASGWQGKVKINEEGGNPMNVKKDRDVKDSLEKKQEKLRGSLSMIYPDYWVICTFEDAIIASDDKGTGTYEILYSKNEEGEITFGTPKEVTEVYAKKRLFSESFDFSNVEKLKETVKGIESIIDTWGSWAGSFTACVDALSDKPGITDPEALCAWLHYQAEGKWPGEKRASKGAELTGPIVLKDNVQKIVFAAVLVPGEPDYDFDKGEKILTREEVERVAHKWMEDYGNIDYMHGLNNVAVPIETYLLPMEWEVEAYGKKMLLPEGTWVMGAKVKKEEVWKKIDSGELTGFSIMGIRETALKQLTETANKGKDISKELIASLKKTLIADLGDNWLVPIVSIVDEACVPKSKFFSIKSKEKEVDKKSIISKVIDMINGTEKKGRIISESTFGDLKKAWESLGKLIKKAEGERAEPKIKKEKEGDIEMKDEEVKELVEKTIDEKLKPIAEQIEKIDKSLEKGEKTEEEKEAEKAKAEKEKVEKEKKEKEEKDKKDISNDELIKGLTEKVEGLEKLVKKGKSNAIKGDATLEEEAENSKKALEEDNRDAMGRSKKKRY